MTDTSKNFWLKLQSKDAKLKPNVYVEEAREYAEDDYREYARS